MKKITAEDFTRVIGDMYGNPRYVIHFTDLLKDTEDGTVEYKYEIALKRAKKLGGKIYRGKDIGGGIVFTTAGTESLSERLNKLINE